MMATTVSDARGFTNVELWCWYKRWDRRMGRSGLRSGTQFSDRRWHIRRLCSLYRAQEDYIRSEAERRAALAKLPLLEYLEVRAYPEQ